LANTQQDEGGEISDSSLSNICATITALAADPNLIKSARFKAFRTLLHQLHTVRQENGMGASLTGQITDALQDSRWEDAVTYLRNMRSLNHVPKLGAVQRWVRFCDAASKSGDDYNTEVMVALDAILRTCDYNQILKTDVSPLKSLEPWEPRPQYAHETFKVTDDTIAHYASQFKVVMHQKGTERRTPNLHDFTLYHSLPDTIKYTAPPKLTRKEIPNVPGAFAIPDLLSISECNQSTHC
jgi:hypothetical protein